MSSFLAGLAFSQSRGLGRAPLLPLQERLRSVPSATAMRKPVRLFFLLLLTAGFARGAAKTPENAPIEITSTGETTYENGLATAHDNVAIHVGDTDIYADYAQYNSRTHEVLAVGHVRIYRDINFYIADRGIYNLDTKKIRATNMRTKSDPYFVSGKNVSEISENGYLVQNGTFTTHDAPTADFHLQAQTIRIYEKDRVIFRNVTFYVGKVPIFWWPYLYQSLSDAFSFTVSPAYSELMGTIAAHSGDLPHHGRHRRADPARLSGASRRGPRIRIGYRLRQGQKQLGQTQDLLSTGSRPNDK